MTNDVLGQVRQIVADIFNVDPREVTSASSPETIETWDSLQHLNLVVALEQAFEVELVPEEIEQMLSVESIVTLLRAKQPRAATLS
jgi:acyl carrier protein